ncbi:MAG: hypothetical protein R6X34_00700 [Chloroflexota bacterium]
MTPIANDLLNWLLTGDVAIQYQAYRDLLDEERPDLRARIALEGWGAQFLQARQPAGHWGRGFYQPKWISTHYTLLDLKHLGITPDLASIRAAISHILAHHKSADGGVNPAKTVANSDVCVNGMFLNYAAYFAMPVESLHSIVDFLIGVQMADGGFNCQSNQQGAVHSSLHSTISVLEGIGEYRVNGYAYRAAELDVIARQAQEFILLHRLFRSDRTGAIISPRFLLLSYPSRWFYDILRTLDYFRSVGADHDPRMQDALNVLRQKRRKDGTWPLQAKHPGQTHFDMETPGGPSRWNTLRALRVLRHFRQVNPTVV